MDIGKKRIPHNRIEVDVGFIIEEYNKGRSAENISKEIGVSKRVVLLRLKENGIKRRQSPQYESITEDILRDLYLDKKLSTRAIAEIFGCTNTLVSKRLKQYGIPLRKHAGDPAFTEEERKEKWGRPREEHNLWKGGVTGINEALRGATEEWRLRELRRGDYTCFVTGTRTGDMNVHHVTPFHVMRDEMIAELGIDLRPTISDYTDLEVELMRERIAAMHEGERGYVLSEPIHKLFHSQYGFDTDYNDLNEFKTRYQQGEFNESEAIA